MTEQLKNFTARLGADFKDVGLLDLALTHRSYVNEHRDQVSEHNERLEFLGDAVLELVVTDYLFNKFPDQDEGHLTAIRAALVNTQSLAEMASDLNFNEVLKLSRGESRDIGRARQTILADAFEAVVGAIYLDQGYRAASDFIAKHLLSKTDDVILNGSWQDAKSKFQEEAQERYGVTPIYQVLEEIGPDHDKRFRIGLYVGERLIVDGEGHSKQEAEQAAAARALSTGTW